MADNKILTNEQYKILLEGSLYFEEYDKNQYCRSVEPRFLSRMQAVYSEFYNSPLNINCGQCVSGALSKLWYHMGVKKYQLEQEEIKRLENEQASKAGNRKSK
jgi:hypothetical protein